MLRPTVINVKPYIKGIWYNQLADLAYFRSVKTPETVSVKG